MTGRPVGTLCMVLHTHLPWLAHHGTWPVGEEWLHQAWSSSYLPLVEVLQRLAGEGRRDLLSLGVTPVLAAQLDDPYCLREQHLWLGRWQLRAEELAARQDRDLRALAASEFHAAARAIATFEQDWRHGGSAALRPLVDDGAIELLGGPATHPVLLLLPEPVARLAVRSGLDDATVRLGSRPVGVWAPECAVSAGLPRLLQQEGVGHLLVDGPTMVGAGGSTDRVWRVGDVGVLGRDLALTDRVWSARSGYPGGADYRDFHTMDHPSGFRPARVTGPAEAAKQPYDPVAAAARARRDAVSFVSAVHERLLRRLSAGEQPLAVVAWDTELFGHWWHEGPAFLEHTLRMLPAAGVRIATLGQVVGEQLSDAPEVELPTGSWGAGKDLHLWSGEPVAELAQETAVVARRLQDVVRRCSPPGSPRDPVLDELAREALLALSSDWAFMVSRDSASAYARGRHDGHVKRFHTLADATEAGASTPDLARPAGNTVVPHLDARVLAATASDRS